MKDKNFFITTPIYYPSGEPHIGHAYSSIIADVFARFKRNDGWNVHFLTGTDEHGLKIQKAAEKANLDPLTYCNNISKVFRSLSKKLNLSNDDFIRTTEKRHKVSVNDLWQRLLKSGDIYLSKYKGWYSISDEAYYNEDEIIEKDGKKVSAFSGSLVDWVEEESFFFKLSSWEKKLLEFYEKNKKFILPLSRRNEVINFVKNGLKDLSVSRTSFTWGIKVPNSNNHVIYVWLDALTNYLSALNYPNINDKLYKNFWPASLHVIGKDILRFHAIYWPAFLLAAKIEPPKRIFGHGWILSGDEKMSKSKGNILNPIEIVNNYGIDEIRYYLMKEVSHGSDGNISLNSLENCINSDLANNYGNLCQRVFAFIKNNCSNSIKKNTNISQSDKKIIKQTFDLTKNLRDLIENQDLNNYIKSVINISFLTNKYINDEEPWKLKKDNIKKMNNILHLALEQIAKISILLNPIIPLATDKVLEALNIKSELRNNSFLDGKKIIPDKINIRPLNILFKKIN
jgi:methionyl-tRNA synthetase